MSSILAGDFSRRGLDPDMAPLYAQALVGSVSMTAQWWLDVREPKKEVVAAHLVNLCWNGLMHLEDDPLLVDESPGEIDVSANFTRTFAPVCPFGRSDKHFGECLRWTHHDRIGDRPCSNPDRGAR